MIASRLDFLVEAPVRPEAPLPPRTRPGGRAVLGTVLAVVVLAVGAGWHEAGARAAAVQLVSLPGGVQCASGTVRLEEAADVPVAVAAVEAGEGCTVDVAIVNTGSRAVDVGRLVLPLLGPRAGNPVRVTAVSPLGEVRADAPPYDSDAVADLDRRLEPGEALPLVLHLVQRTDGCGVSNGWWTSPPHVEVRSLGRTVERTPALPLFAVGGTSFCSG